jgi:hypothetical protein
MQRELIQSSVEGVQLQIQLLRCQLWPRLIWSNSGVSCRAQSERTGARINLALHGFKAARLESWDCKPAKAP